MDIIEQWDRLMDVQNLHYYDDSPSVLQNHSTFRENRHDQSIFTLLLKSNHYWAEPVQNFTPENESELKRLWNDEPILQLRDRQKSLRTFAGWAQFLWRSPICKNKAVRKLWNLIKQK